MIFGLYLFGELMETFNSSIEAHEAAIEAEEETGWPHEVKIIN